MKNTIYLICLVILTYSLQGQTIPNADFEEWEQNILPAYEEPSPWNSPNPFTSFLNAVCVTKSDDAFNGNYSARMETIELEVGSTKYQVPGLVTYADFNIDITSGAYTFSGGTLLQKKVASLKGKYKYSPVENDSASVLIYCFRHPEGEQIDTIGVGLKYLHEAQTWTDFTVNMEYYNNHVPDTFNVLLLSTGTFELGYMPPGSVLYMDHLTIDTVINSSISEYNLNANLYPNPASDKLSIKLDKEGNDRKLIISDIYGREINSINFNGKAIDIDVSNLSTGTYTYRIYNKSKLVVKGTFIKN